MVWHALLRGLISLGAALWPQSGPASPEGGPPPGHPERWSPPSAEERELWRRLVE
ncbi:DUF6059 family protein [Actinosynnema sp. NPDC051121]